MNHFDFKEFNCNFHFQNPLCGRVSLYSMFRAHLQRGWVGRPSGMSEYVEPCGFLMRETSVATYSSLILRDIPVLNLLSLL